VHSMQSVEKARTRRGLSSLLILLNWVDLGVCDGLDISLG
jgi:hypothetical protein